MFSNGHALRGELMWTYYRLLLRVENDNIRNALRNEPYLNSFRHKYIVHLGYTLFEHKF